MYECSVCGYVYNEKVEDGPFDGLSEDWHCPICYAAKEKFIKK